MPRTYLNEEKPPQGIPPKNMGRIEVFVRLVGSELGERYPAGTALRWTSTHVMVSFQDGGYPGHPNAVSLAWVRAEDVWRVTKRSKS